jgi:hypothetical protein
MSVVALLLVSCAAWETSSPSYTPPPVDGPVPSHYAPPPPVDPRVPTGTPPGDPPRSGNVRVAIASVQLLDDCPDPVPAASDASAGATMSAPESASRAKPTAGPAIGKARWSCAQSTVQLSVRADFAGQLRIEAVRVLDATSTRTAGSTTLRGPTVWSDANGTYAPWNERTVAGTDLRISYMLGNLDLSRAAELVGPQFNAYMGPFLLEIDVSVDGKRQTIRSGEFSREPVEVMVT